jgi:hypothetical protein
MVYSFPQITLTALNLELNLLQPHRYILVWEN